MSKKNDKANEAEMEVAPQQKVETPEKEVDTENGNDVAEDLKTQMADLNDKYLRLYSDFDNYRKRVNKEKLEMVRTAASGVVLALLPVIDDMERALAAFRQSIQDETAGSQEALMEGVSLIYNKLLNVLKQQGVKECEVTGKPFDAETAEAVAQIPAPEENLKGCVLDVVQKGYAIEDKVLRFAKVVVGC